MPKQQYLRPHDVCVLLQLVLTPEATFRELSAAAGLSLGETHNASRRLELARLVISGDSSVNVRGATDFLTAGVPYCFPAQLGPPARGIPTAFSAPWMAGEFPSDEAVVWPGPSGQRRGPSVTPLSPSVDHIAQTNPDLYRLLTFVDALRIGRARERAVARERLEQALKSAPDQSPSSHSRN